MERELSLGMVHLKIGRYAVIYLLIVPSFNAIYGHCTTLVCQPRKECQPIRNKETRNVIVLLLKHRSESYTHAWGKNVSMPTHTSTTTLYKDRKLLFLRSIFVVDDDGTCKQVLPAVNRHAMQFNTTIFKVKMVA